MSEERKRKKKKGKDDESILENEIFHIMEVSLKEALDMALDDILKERLYFYKNKRREVNWTILSSTDKTQ